MVIEMAVGMLVAWLARKAGRVGKRMDGITDSVLDASAEKLHALVLAKLGADPALAKLTAEAAETGEVGDRTKARVQLALEDAAEDDKQFAAALTALVPTSGGVTVGGNVSADRGGIAIVGVTGGSVTIDNPSKPASS